MITGFTYSPGYRYMAKVEEMKLRAMLVAQTLGIPEETVKAAVDREFTRRTQTWESNSHLELWDWVRGEMLAGKTL